MNEERLQDYLNVIDELLNSPGGEEWKVLNDNQHLIDAGLVQIFAQVAEVLVHNGERQAADFLINIANSMAQALGLTAPTSQLTFLSQVLQATEKSNGNPQVLYPLLQANLDKLDDNFAQLLQSWATDTLLEVNPEQAKRIAGAISDFSTLMAQFPLGNKAENLEIAITGYEVIATIFTYDVFPQGWALTQNNLGNAYRSRILGERAENLEQAINCFENALQIYTRDAFPEDWAMVQNNLCNTYSQRIRGERAKNLEQAIDYCKNALLVPTPETFSEYWADTQINLGNAYSLRLQGERSENLEQAINCYKKALQIYTYDRFPEEWATIYSNLAVAYLYRIHGERAENLEQAINCSEKALQVRTREAFPDKWAETQNNLGEAYRKRIHGHRAENFKRAIACYEKALQVYTYDAFPEQWAMTQNNLGEACRTSFWGERAKNLEQAIRCYEKVLQIYTCDAFPERWATTQNNLAAAYGERVYGSRAKNLERAISYVQKALQVHSRDSFPYYHAETQLNLSLAYQDAGQFPSAFVALKVGIDTVESLRSEIISGSGNEQAKQKLAEEYNTLYQRIVAVCLELAKDEPKYYYQAIEYVERSKARNLVELLANKNLHPKRDPYPNSGAYQTHCDQLDQLRREIPAKQRELEILTSTWESEERYRDEIERQRQELNHLKQQQDELLREINQVDSSFTFTQKVEPIPFSDIQALTNENTAIVQWYITGSQILTFIITRHNPHPIVVPSSLEDMSALEDWDKEYQDAYRQQKSQWITNLAFRLQHLAQILHIDEILCCIDDIFSQRGVRCDRLILIPHRYLHLFPLHALPLADGNLLLDRFSKGVGYAPSCQLLKLAKDQEQHRPHFNRLFAIQNPTRSRSKPLLGSKLEVDRIRQHFDSDHSIVLAEAEATEAKVNQRMTQLRSAHCVHFSCHGEFKPETPLQSALLLADPEDKLGEDANLTLGKIFEKLYLNQCRLVTFSACESGMTDPTSISDEYIGLPSGFLYAGSLSIVSTLWTVDPLATTLLMVKFYKNLKHLPELKAGDVALALKKAQTWLRTLTSKKLARIQNNRKFQRWVEQSFENLPKRDRNKFNDLLHAAVKRQPSPFANPYYWSAFVATGL